jgi:hypothetical protein
VAAEAGVEAGVGPGVEVSVEASAEAATGQVLRRAQIGRCLKR